MTPDTPVTQPAVAPSTHRPYRPCDGKRAAALLDLSLPAWDARRARSTLWFELGGDDVPVATGTRPRDRAADSLPLIGIAPPFLGVCLPGATWVFDDSAVTATRDDPLFAVALAAQHARGLPDYVRQMRALLEDAP